MSPSNTKMLTSLSLCPLFFFPFSQALIAVAWFDFGLTLIWMAILAAAASTYGGFRVPEGDLMTAEEFEARQTREKAEFVGH
jgi:hypothetical protein